jgi:hypothetical protein
MTGSCLQPPRLVVACGCEAAGIGRCKAGQPSAKGSIPAAVVLRARHGQVRPCAGSRGQAEAGQRVRHLEQDPGGLQQRRPDYEREQDVGEGGSSRGVDV